MDWIYRSDHGTRTVGGGGRGEEEDEEEMYIGWAYVELTKSRTPRHYSFILCIMHLSLF